MQAKLLLPVRQKILFFSAIGIFCLSFSYFWQIPIRNLGSINVLDLFLSFFIFFSLLKIIREKTWKNLLLFSQKNSLLIYSLVIFLFLTFFSATKNQTFWDGIGLWKSFFLLPIVFSLFLAFWKKEFSWKSRSFFLAIWVVGCFLAIGAFWFWLAEKLTYDERLSFVFSSPNQLALSLSPALFVGLKELFASLKKKTFFLSFLFLTGNFFLLFCLWQTRSLGFVIFFPLTSLLFFLSPKKIFNLKAIFGLFLIFQFFLLLNWSELLETFQYQKSLQPTSADSRIVIWQVSEKIFEKNYFSGIGLGNFQTVYLEYQKYFPPYPQWAVPHAHNLFFQIWIELGLLSFIFWIICIFLFLSSWPQKNNPLFWVVLCYFLFYGLVEATFWKNDLALIFWFCLIVGQIHSEKSSANSINKK